MVLASAQTCQRPKQIGLIVLQADETLEPDFRRLVPDDVECLVSRVPSDTVVSSDTLRAMKGKLSAAAALLPRGAQFAGVGYGCTSGTAEIGADEIAALIQDGVDTPRVTQPVSALIAACRHLGVRRIGLVSPYVQSVSHTLRTVLEAQGLHITAFASFEEAQEERVVRIAPQSILEAAVAMGQNADCDAVFLSCTNLRTLDIIEQAEAQIGKPVLSSNQVLAWHLGRIAGFGARDGAPGRLFGPVL